MPRSGGAAPASFARGPERAPMLRRHLSKKNKICQHHRRVPASARSGESATSEDVARAASRPPRLRRGARRTENEMLIFGIESSCDETACAVAECGEGGLYLLSNAVATQIETHARYGGVVPEIASRAHSEAISPIARRAIADAGIAFTDIDAVAVTVAPGLIGSLLVGVSYAKALAFSLGVPLIPVNHMKAHVAAAYYTYPDLVPPFYAVVVSGSHTSVYSVTSRTAFSEIASSRDDAAGEAFDKVGRVIGLSYPCGAAMDKLATDGANAERIRLPSPALRDDSLDFSFSGLKTAVINHVHSIRQRLSLGESDDLPQSERLSVAASFTDTVCSGICEKVAEAMDRFGEKNVVLAGGVAANSHLRRALGNLCGKRGVKFFVPDLSLCGDNGAMVAAQGYYDFLAGARADVNLNAYASEEGASSDGIFTA